MTFFENNFYIVSKYIYNLKITKNLFFCVSPLLGVVFGGLLQLRIVFWDLFCIYFNVIFSQFSHFSTNHVTKGVQPSCSPNSYVFISMLSLQNRDKNYNDMLILMKISIFWSRLDELEFFLSDHICLVGTRKISSRINQTFLTKQLFFVNWICLFV